MHAERPGPGPANGAGERGRKSHLAAAGIDDDTTAALPGLRRSLMFLVVLPTFSGAVFNTIITADRGFSHLSGFGSLARDDAPLHVLPAGRRVGGRGTVGAAATLAPRHAAGRSRRVPGADRGCVLPYEWKLKTDTADGDRRSWAVLGPPSWGLCGVHRPRARSARFVAACGSSPSCPNRFSRAGSWSPPPPFRCCCLCSFSWE